MNPCDDVRRLLPLSAGGDLADDQVSIVSLHLVNCEACRFEAETYRSVISWAKSAYTGEYRLSPVVRRKIAVEAAERATRGLWSRPLTALLPRQVPVFATAMAALLVVVAGLPIALRQGRQMISHDRTAEVMQIEVVVDGNAVKLAWSDGSRQSYTITKTTDPRTGAGQEAHLVKGNVWVDDDPQSSPVVFYKIE